MLLSAHGMAEATKDSVLGLGLESKRSSVVFRWRATRIPATIASTRLRPSSMREAYPIRALMAYAKVIASGLNRADIQINRQNSKLAFKMRRAVGNEHGIAGSLD